MCDRVGVGAPRQLSRHEIAELLGQDLVGHLATVDDAGYPHVTGLWFHWDGEVARMTSLPGRPHVKRLMRNPKAGLAVDVEAEERVDGERPNRQVRLVGDVTLLEDVDGRWTDKITRRYVQGVGATERREARRQQRRILIELRPETVIGVASTPSHPGDTAHTRNA